METAVGSHGVKVGEGSIGTAAFKMLHRVLSDAKQCHEG